MLSDIPNEILVHIVQQFDSHEDALNLAQCCRHFYNLLRPHAFTTIQFRHACFWELSCVVHFLIQNPEYASNVRRLFLSMKSKMICKRHDPRRLRYDPATILTALQTICHSEEEKEQWCKDLQDIESKEPWVALLLVLLPRLLCLETEFDYPSLDMGHILDRALHRPKTFDVRPPFPSLQEAWIGYWDTEMGVHFSRVVPFFQSPEMRRFYGNQIIAYDGEERADSLLPPGISNITDINLVHSNCGRGIGLLLRACARLETFNYFHADGSIGDTSFDPQAFYPSLYHHKDNIRQLTLLYDDGHYPLGADEEYYFLGSLAEFSALKELYIRPDNILCWENEERNSLKLSLTEVLPASLETLYLDEALDVLDLEFLAQKLEEMIRNKKMHFPCLSTLALSAHQCPIYPKIDITTMTIHPPANSPTPTGRTESLHALCQEMGVQLVLFGF